MEIDLLELFYVLRSKILAILMCGIIFGGLAFGYAKYLVTPQYTSSSMMLVLTKETTLSSLANLQIGSQLTKDYSLLITSRPVLEDVIKNLKLDMEYRDLANCISVNNPTDTRILEITATSTDPQMAMDLAETMAEEAIDYLPDTMSTLAPNLAQHAKLPESKVAPSYTKFTMIGALLGLLICAAFFIVKYLMDDTIHTADDMEKYFGLVPLTTIPDSDQVIDLDEEQHRRRGRKRGRKK